MVSRDLPLGAPGRALETPAAGDFEHGPLPFVARVLLLAAAPLSMIWVPVAAIPGAGNVAATDAVLLALWGIVAVDVVLRGIAAQDVASTRSRHEERRGNMTGGAGEPGEATTDQRVMLRPCVMRRSITGLA